MNANAHLPLEGGRVLSQAKEAGGVIAAVLDVPSRRRTAVTTPPGGFVATLPSRGRETLSLEGRIDLPAASSSFLIETVGKSRPKNMRWE